MRSFDEVMAGVQRAAIAGHVRPDGDCVGSCMGLAAYLRANYQVKVDVFLDPLPDSLEFLVEGKEINPKTDETVRYDIFFAVDCADKKRIAADSRLIEHAAKVINIDHHISNPLYGDINVVEAESSSACEVLYGLMDAEKINRETAICLYTGMAHDTGIFQYSCVSPLTMSRAGHLLSFGFDFSQLIMSSFYEKSLSHQKLLGIALMKSRILPDGLGIWSYVTLADMEAVASSSMEADGIVEELRNTKGIDYSVFLYELEPGTYKVSFRSKGKVNVSQVAVAFGGGGHVRASGCTFVGKTPDEIIAQITEQIAGQIHD
ncbi:MAG: bifunctional oligoribonuclease/PAP phosphatase NrnA [Lachnospiraceae bacterium]|nr:bifunctional oligoribonuclease/PAP phosphatase NrnA [Lachnospiraceae bacterium]